MEKKLITSGVNLPLADRVRNWSDHPDVIKGCESVLSALMLRSWGAMKIAEAVSGDVDPDMIVGAMIQQCDKAMMGDDDNPREFTPVQLTANLKNISNDVDSFISEHMNGALTPATAERAFALRAKLEENDIHIVSISGGAGCGKDTLADLMSGYATTYTEYFARPLKESLGRLMNWTLDDMNDPEWKKGPCEQLGMSRRKVLQKFGTEAMRSTFGQDFWVNLMIANLERIVVNARQYRFDSGVDDRIFVMITDTRFKNEMELLSGLGGTCTRITRPVPEGDAEEAAHRSERDLDGAEFDVIIENDGTLEELEKKVEGFMGYLMDIKKGEEKDG